MQVKKNDKILSIFENREFSLTSVLSGNVSQVVQLGHWEVLIGLITE